MAEAYIGLGSNLGNKRAHLEQALAELSRSCTLEKLSSLFATEPVGNKQQDWFLNAVAQVRCEIAPAELLNLLLSVEKSLGRVRTIRNAPRIIDLDLLLYGNLVIDREIAVGDGDAIGRSSGNLSLIVPHPRLHERRFVLEPLAEIAPDVVHPVLRRPIRDLASDLAGPEKVQLVERVWFQRRASLETP